jgi:hypothetical protein
MHGLLKKLRILQEKTFLDPLLVTHTKVRFNPYNPLTYIVLILVPLIGLIMFGIVGVQKEIDFKNDFIKFYKWR